MLIFLGFFIFLRIAVNQSSITQTNLRINSMSLHHNIALSFVKNLGPSLAKSLLAYLGSTEDILRTSPAKMRKIPGVGDKRIAQWDFDDALKKAEKELIFIEKQAIEVIFYTDSRYPKRLKNCGDSPVLLYAKGKMELNPPHIISIVGTRNATDYGRQLCRQLIEELQQYNVLIVSGLALGIDVAAHKECLRLNMPTVGVLATGWTGFIPVRTGLLQIECWRMVVC